MVTCDPFMSKLRLWDRTPLVGDEPKPVGAAGTGTVLGSHSPAATGRSDPPSPVPLPAIVSGDVLLVGGGGEDSETDEAASCGRLPAPVPGSTATDSAVRLGSGDPAAGHSGDGGGGIFRALNCTGLAGGDRPGTAAALAGL